jgi:hypothetical protein
MAEGRLGRTLLLAGLLALAPTCWADPEVSPSAGAMMADAVVARPVGVVITVLGAAAFVVSLPFSLLGGNVDEAADKLVMGPVRETFVRCLGCARPGYRD